MKSLVLLVCSLLLLATVSYGQTLNCNLENGAGCSANGPYFYLSYQSTHSGYYSNCKKAYNLRVTPPSNSRGFECSFVTDNSPQPSTYRYTISHNPTTYWGSNTAHVRVYGNDALIKTANAGSGTYFNNWWYHPNAHSSYGYSYAYYKFETRHLYYYSSNTGDQHSSGHPYGFTPLSQTTYIGLNKKYESSSYGGYGLCQIYCRIVTQYSGRGTSAGYSASPGENTSAPSTPSRPPAPPSGSRQ